MSDSVVAFVESDDSVVFHLRAIHSGESIEEFVSRAVSSIGGWVHPDRHPRVIGQVALAIHDGRDEGFVYSSYLSSAPRTIYKPSHKFRMDWGDGFGVAASVCPYVGSPPSSSRWPVEWEQVRSCFPEMRGVAPLWFGDIWQVPAGWSAYSPDGVPVEKGWRGSRLIILHRLAGG